MDTVLFTRILLGGSGQMIYDCFCCIRIPLRNPIIRQIALFSPSFSSCFLFHFFFFFDFMECLGSGCTRI